MQLLQCIQTSVVLKKLWGSEVQVRLVLVLPLVLPPAKC
jgi:hypothetical protein